MLSTGGSGRDFYHHHHPQQQQPKRYYSKQHHQHPTLSNIYATNSHGSSSRSGVDQYPSHVSLVSVPTQSRGDSSDGGSVHSAPQTLQRQQYQQSRYPSSHVVVVERREPSSTVKSSDKWKDHTTPSKSKNAAASLPPNYKQVAKSAKRVIDDLKKAADTSCPQERRIIAITNACAEFDHPEEARHNVELQEGAASALCKVLAAVPPPKTTSSKVSDSSDDEIRMIASALEMVFRGHAYYVHAAFGKCGNQMLPLLLQLLEQAENGNLKHADVSILNISKVLLYISRIAELRVTLARHPGMLNALQRVATSILNDESRVVRVRTIANLVNADDENKQLLNDGLLDSLLRIANLDLNDQAREYAVIALMDLAGASCNQLTMAKNEKVLGTLVKVVLVEKVGSARESAITALQNLAFTKENRVRLVSFKQGIILECLKKALSSDKNDKSRRRAAGALTNLSCDETAETMGGHKGLLETLALVSTKDDSPNVQSRAAIALTKLAASITVHMSCFYTLMDALVVASLSPVANSVSAVLRVKARDPENRERMAQHKGILDTLADICINNKNVTKDLDSIKDRDNAMRAIMHLTNDSNNRTIMCTKPILDALVQGASITNDAISRTKELVEIRDSAVRAIERLATEFSNRRIMARHEGLLVAIAMATEREQKLEAAVTKGGTILSESQQTSHAFLAKPLLMSLLVSM
jgi:hypothetical protein